MVDNSLRRFFPSDSPSSQNMDSGTTVQKHAYKYYIGHSFSKHILSNVVGGMQPYKIFSVLLGLGNNENTNGGP